MTIVTDRDVGTPTEPVATTTQVLDTTTALIRHANLPEPAAVMVDLMVTITVATYDDLLAWHTHLRGGPLRHTEYPLEPGWRGCATSFEVRRVGRTWLVSWYQRFRTETTAVGRLAAAILTPDADADLHTDLHPQPGDAPLPVPAGVEVWACGGRAARGGAR